MTVKALYDYDYLYVQAWLPMHQIYQGNCGGTTFPRSWGSPIRSL